MGKENKLFKPQRRQFASGMINRIEYSITQSNEGTGMKCVLLSILLVIFSTNLLLASAGDLDPTFDGDGIVITDFTGAGGTAMALALQNDGKIVVAGEVNEGNENFAVARYNADGSLDSSFSGDGKVTTDFAGGNDSARDVAIQSDGKIVLAGRADVGSAVFALVRYNPDGTLDNTFSGDGKVTTDFAGVGDEGRALAIQSDGKIIVAGYTHEGATRYNFAVARYNPNGSLDTNFSGDGMVTTDFATFEDLAFDVAIQSDSRIVVIGSSEDNVADYFGIAVYNPDGSLGFKFTTDFSNFGEEAYSVALQPDGKIIIAGVASDDFALARYDSFGNLDNTFNGNGKVLTDFGGSHDGANSIAIQSDGMIVAVGYTNGGSDFALARYNSDGSLDNSFGVNGKVVTNLLNEANTVAIQTDRKIVVAGTGYDGDFTVARYEGGPPCIFCDTFNDGVLATNWTYRKGIWNESSGVLTSTPQRKAIAVATPAFSGCATCTVQTRMRTGGGTGNRVWLLGWYLDSDNFVELMMKEESDKWVLKQHSGGVVVAKQKGLQIIDPNTDYDAEISFDGTNFQVMINGQLLITMPKFGGTSPSGTVGFQIKATTGSFDFVSVF